MAAAAVLLWVATEMEEAPPVTRGMVMVLALFFAALAVWGILSGAGVFRRRPWARISMVIFAVLLVGMGASALIGVFLIRIPQSGLRAGFPIRLVIAVFYLGLTLIGAWWMLLFSSAGGTRYFSEVPPSASARQLLSSELIGWYLLVAALATGAAAVIRLPALMFGLVFTGWIATTIYTACTALEIYLGAGLLAHDESARFGAIAYFGFLFANGVADAVRPGAAGRLLESVPMAQRFPVLRESNLDVLAWAAAGLALPPLLVLVRRRREFRQNH